MFSPPANHGVTIERGLPAPSRPDVGEAIENSWQNRDFG
jgi:hypothetical protein